MFTYVSLTKLGMLQPLFLQITSQLQSLSPLFLELQASTGLLMSFPLVPEPLLSFFFLSLFFRLDIFSLSSSSRLSSSTSILLLGPSVNFLFQT